MNMDHFQRLIVNRQVLNPRPRNWRLVAGLALVFIIAIALLLRD
jgi:hypothetical protein